MEEVKFIDLHYHVNPDLYLRRHNAIEAGKIYKELAGMALIQSHLGSTIEVASLAYEENLPVLGSIVLNKVTGGILEKTISTNLAKLTHKLSDYAILVSFPSNTGRKHTSVLKRNLASDYLTEIGLQPEVVSENGKLKISTIEVLKFALDNPIVLSTGHASKEEVYLLAEYAYKIGLKKLLVTQPANPLTGLKGEELYNLSVEFNFLWFEQTALTYLLGYQTWEDFSYVIKNVPRVIYSSDLGQTSMMDIHEWYNVSLSWFKEMEISHQLTEEVMKKNPIDFIKI